jgi:hypothetical protein
LSDLKRAEEWSDKEDPDSTKDKERDVSKYQFSARADRVPFCDGIKEYLCHVFGRNVLSSS